MNSFATTKKLKILKREPSAPSKIVEIMKTHVEQWYLKKEAPVPKGPPKAREEEGLK